MEIYLKLFLLGLLLALVSTLLSWLDLKTKFGKLSYAVRQIIFGIVFGGLAVLGTEYGVPVEDSTANIRDAAPLCAGFLFGAPAGIIAGIIGGVERWFSTLWGAGEYTRIACSVSTVIAGFYAAFIRLWICGNKRPSLIMGAAAGVVMESFHLLMVFLTHTDSLSTALLIVRLLTFPMLSMTAAAILMTFLLVGLTRHFRVKRVKNKRISEKMRRILMWVFVLCFVITMILTRQILLKMAEKDTNEVMKLCVISLRQDLEETLHESGRSAASMIATTLDRNRTRSLTELAENYGLTVIHVVSRDGIITASNDISSIDFDLKSTDNGRKIINYFKEYGDTSLPYEYCFFQGKLSGIPVQYFLSGMKNGGFVMAGIDQSSLHDTEAEALMSLSANRNIHVNGYFMITDKDGYEAIKKPDYESVHISDATGISRELFDDEEVLRRGKVFYRDSYFMRYEYDGLSIIPVLPSSEALDSCHLSLYFVGFVQLIIYAIVYALIYKLLERGVVKPIDNINGSLGKIMDGELDERVEEHSTSEFDSLSNDINQTVSTLKDYITEAENRMEQELTLAKNIQRSSLPTVFPPYPDSREYQIFASMDPAKSVGGDFYDIFRLVGRRLVFMVADVFGKGIPAAMFMMTAKTMIKNLMESGLSLSEAFTEANNRLCEGNEAEMFVTAWLGVLQVETGHVTYVNAGHNPPLIYKNGEGFKYFRSAAGFVLAGLPDIRYKQFEMDLQPGEKIFLYTDGAPEAVNPALEQFGEQRLLDFVNANSGDAPDELIPKVRAEIESFADGAEQFDDITMLELVYKGEA